MKVEKKEDEVDFTETPIKETPEKEFEFTDEVKAEFKELMDGVRGNYLTIEELGRKNREYFEKLHQRIREIHPELADGRKYVYNPTTHKIQNQKEQ